MVEEHNGTSFTEYIWNGNQKLALMTGQTLSKGFIPLPGGTQVKYNPSNVVSTYRVTDWLGSLRIGSNPNRTYAWSVAFAPFGERYAAGGTPAFTFTGQTEDVATGLYDFLAREEHNGQGRWISPDPAGFASVDPSNPQSWNQYASVLNNPLLFVDPLGLSGTCDKNGNCHVEVWAPYPSPFAYFYDMPRTQSPRCPDDSAWPCVEKPANNVSCNSTTGICAPSSMTQPRPHGCGLAVAQGALSVGLDIVGAIPGFGNAVSQLPLVLGQLTASSHMGVLPMG